jgi:hypothetical protein
MNPHQILPKTFALVLLFLGTLPLSAARLAELSVVDRETILLRVLDGEVELVEDLDRIPKPYTNIDGTYTEADVVSRYLPALETTQAQTSANFILSSNSAPAYEGRGQNVAEVHRRTKLNGMAIREWSTEANDYTYETTFEHQLFLRLPAPLEQGGTYTLSIASETGIDRETVSFTYDIFQSRSEAIHINLAGYWKGGGIKSADLYQWMGDGGARDYSGFEGNTVYLRNVESGATHEVGTVEYWMSSRNELGGWNYTRSNVWNIDFTGFTKPGTYRLAVEGVGCSEAFEISARPRKLPFDVTVQGYYFMRIGQPEVDSVKPVPRQPLYLPGEDPPDCKVYLTEMHPWHPDWGTFVDGDRWDGPEAWDAYRLPGSPTNPNARGGHSDALDWDRHLGHVSNIYDMLMPFILTGGIVGDDDTGIAESGNGIPDLLDSARYEVDFWLSLKTEHGYGHGVTNPTDQNVLYQAGPTAIAAWANALNAAMLAEAFRIARNEALMQEYLEAAQTAFSYADGLDNPMLNYGQDIGWMKARGVDFKMMAAAYLYNLTGDTAYEDTMARECVVKTSAEVDLSAPNHEQLYGAVAYLSTPRTVNYPSIRDNMRAAIIRAAWEEEAGQVASRPSRRSSDRSSGWFQTNQMVQRTIVAHHVSEDPEKKSALLDALLLEADWGLGRNPMNMIQMTTASTPLQDKRSVELCYTTGQFDGVPGLHPGHTPYMNVDDWWDGMIMFKPSWMTDQCYPSWSQWPHAEAHFNSRHVFANSEFTPRQTMRGKLALYAYLLSLEHALTPRRPAAIHLEATEDEVMLHIDESWPGSHHRLQHSTNLADWNETGFTFFGAPSSLQWPLPELSTTSGYFRVVSEP